MLKAQNDDFMINPTSLPFNTEIHKALHPHQDILESLALDSKNISKSTFGSIPVLNQNKTVFQKGDWQSYCGGITQDDEARIKNYIYHKVIEKKTLHPLSLDLCFAHARTLLVAYQFRSQFLEKLDPSSVDHGAEKIETFILQEAWKRLNEYTGLSLDGSTKIEPADVGMEAMELFDWAMFSRSKKAGVAGNMQWGLDVGMHEDNWNPYYPGGPEIDEEIRKGKQTELKVYFKRNQCFGILSTDLLLGWPCF